MTDVADRVVVDGVPQTAFTIGTDGAQYLLVLSRTGNYASTGFDSEERSARLYATLFAESPDGAVQQWRIQDGVDDCPVDVTASFTTPAVAVSDADADGLAEIWVSYRTACRGDVSPSTLKLIGYEGEQKYALRGSSKTYYGEDGSDGGDFSADAAFKQAPALLEQASSLWQTIRDERF